MPDGILIRTDYCDNRGPIIGPRPYEEFVYSAYKVPVEVTRHLGKYFIKHTDGYTWSILDSLVAAGTHAWHGIQQSIGMEPELLKEKYAGKLAFLGGVDCDILVLGTPEDVVEEAKYAIKHAAPGGDFAMTSGNSLYPGVKHANYAAMVEATHHFGRYPIRL
ncbi:MAG: hypothetical protein HYY04_04495 [Chloroflexi bacterium]|nr:hypothetical protein [Chloroflexota bacterium]